MTARIPAIVLALVLGLASPVAGRDLSGAAAPDEVILKFRPDVDAAGRHRLLAALGATETTSLGRTGALLVRLAAPVAAETVALHAADPSLAYIEPNARYHAEGVPNESWFPQQWALLNTGQTGGTPGADIHATSAWDLATGLPSVVIGVIDSGIDLTHPDLAANLYVNPGEIPANGLDDDGNGFVDDVGGWDFVAEDNDPQDENGHGTFMAGIIGAEANNGLGIAGVCWRVSLMPLRFLDATGSGSTADAVRALDYATAMGVPITNNSWGGGDFSPALHDAIVLARQAGMAFVATAGGSSSNLDVTPVYPACYDVENVVTVAATDDDDQLTTSSNYGSATVDLGAPGDHILTTQLGGSYLTMSGTSAATAFVSGALGLILTRYPQASGLDAARHLLLYTEKVPGLTGYVRTGRLDAYAPLAAVPSGVTVETGGRGIRLWATAAGRGEARLGLYLPRAGRTRLVVYDVRGRRVRDLFTGFLPEGDHELAWDGRTDRGAHAASGLYFVRLTGESGSATARVVVGR